MNNDRKDFEEELFGFLGRKYVQRADERQKSMGLQYTEAETHDLAKEVTNFLFSRFSVTVGGGLSVFGNHEAISRVQDYIMLDSTHPVEREDVRRGLMRQIEALEAQLEEHRVTGELSK